MDNVKNSDKKLFSRKKRYIDIISNIFFNTHKGNFQSLTNLDYQSKMKIIALEISFERLKRNLRATKYFKSLCSQFKELKK